MKLLLLLLAGCASHGAAPDGALLDAGATDARAGYECSTLCQRPSDCAVAYADDDICPAGFLCETKFRCVTDGGETD